jgi:sugar lactone lactonase YvrE
MRTISFWFRTILSLAPKSPRPPRPPALPILALVALASISAPLAHAQVNPLYAWTNFVGLPGEPGSAGGIGTAARFNEPAALALDTAGNLYVADYANHTIRKVTPAGLVTTLAGSPGEPGSDDGTGSAARFDSPAGIVVDAAGNIYVADSWNCTIRKVTPAGVVTTWAGTAGEFGSEDGTGSAARFDGPCGLAIDSSGNVYVADSANSVIRKITSSRVVTTLAGTAWEFGSEDGTGSAARFNGPTGVAVDGSGNVYVADNGNHTIRKITPSKVVTTLAGLAGEFGSDDGIGDVARFNYPFGVAADSAGNVYVADSANSTIRKVTTSRQVSTLGGSPDQSGTADGIAGAAQFSGPSSVALAGTGALYVTDQYNHRISRGSLVFPPSITAQPSSQTVAPGSAVSFSVTASGMLPLSYQWYRNGAPLPGATATNLSLTAGAATAGGYTVVVSNPAGSIRSAIAALFVTGLGDPLYAWTNFVGQPGGPGNADGTGSGARFSGPAAITADFFGNLYVADSGNNTIRKVTPNGVVSTFVGRAGLHGTNNGTGTAAEFYAPASMATDLLGNLYVADWGNSSIRKITREGIVTTYAGSPLVPGSADGLGTAARFRGPRGLALDSAGNLFVADTDNHTIRKIGPAGMVTTLAGSPGLAGTNNGTGSAARFGYPYSIALDPVGNLFVADGGNNTIRKITPAGDVTTLAGSAGQPGETDGNAAAARFHFPIAVAVDYLTNLYVADAWNYAIRKISPAGIVTTLAGYKGYGGSGSVDGTGSAARFNYPSGVAVDNSGNVFVADYENCTIRKVTPAGTVTTLAGHPIAAGLVDGTGSAARFNVPVGVAVDNTGTLFVADAVNASIRKVAPGGEVTTPVPPSAGLRSPAGIAVDAAGNAYFADQYDNTILKLSPSGLLTTLAGTAGEIGFLDGTGSAARFNSPSAVAVDLSGNVYVADTWNSAIRKINPAGVVTTLVHPSAGLNMPGGVAADTVGNIYVADTWNDLIRKVTPGGVMTTLAGNNRDYREPTITDGLGGAARFYHPQSLAVDATGNLYVTEACQTIRKVTPGGLVTTIGNGVDIIGGADGLEGSASFSDPVGIAVDRAGVLYVADSSNHRIAKGTPVFTPSPWITTQPYSQYASFEAEITFRFAAVCSQPVACQWYLNGVPVPGANSPEFSTIATWFTAGDYTVVASNAYGAITSAVASLAITRYHEPLYVWANFVGQPGGPGNANGPRATARLSAPDGIAVAPDGTLFVAEAENATLRKVSPDGTVTLLAGASGLAGNVDGPGGTARFDHPAGIALDSSGNLYVADELNHTLRKLSPAGFVTTLAGWPATAGSADGSSASARFNRPSAVALDSQGNIFVADSYNHTIRKVTPEGNVTTFAGQAGSPGAIDATGTAARFSFPHGVAVDAANNVFVADEDNHTIRKISPAGVVTTLAGSPGLAGNLDGTGSAARFDYPSAIAMDLQGHLLVGAAGSIRRVTPAGIVTTFAVNTGDAGLAVDTVGNVFVADFYNHAVQKVTPSGIVTTFAGTAEAWGSQDGTGTSARFYRPGGIALDGTGNTYVADTANNTIRKVTTAGVVTTLAGLAGPSGLGSADGLGSAARFHGPSGIASSSDGTLFVSDQFNYTIRKITPAGAVTTLAGTAGVWGTNDGSGLAARFGQPAGLVLDSAGHLLVADSGNNTIRKVSPSGLVSTLAGSAGTAGFVDGTGAAARFKTPTGVAIDTADNLYVVDSQNRAVRKVTPAGAVTTVAGPSASFFIPAGIAIDLADNLFVADAGNRTILKLPREGEPLLIGGWPGTIGGADGISTAAHFSLPWGLAIDRAGTLYLADSSNHRITRGLPVPLGGTAQQLDFVPGVSVTIQFVGIPGLLYEVQRAPGLTAPWTVVHTTNAPPGGIFLYTDLNPPQPEAFYRLFKP